MKEKEFEKFVDKLMIGVFIIGLILAISAGLFMIWTCVKIVGIIPFIAWVGIILVVAYLIGCIVEIIDKHYE